MLLSVVLVARTSYNGEKEKSSRVCHLTVEDLTLLVPVATNSVVPFSFACMIVFIRKSAIHFNLHRHLGRVKIIPFDWHGSFNNNCLSFTPCTLQFTANDFSSSIYLSIRRHTRSGSAPS